MEKAYVTVESDEDGYLIELIVNGYEKEVTHTQSLNEKNACVRRYQIMANEYNL